jgi:preprotein translocase subunit YajC
LEILIPLAILFGFFWFFVLLPQRRRSGDHTRMQDTLVPGEVVITAGGLHGTIVEIEETVIDVEIAPGIVVRIDRRAIAARVEPDTDDADDGVPLAPDTHDDVSP